MIEADGLTKRFRVHRKDPGFVGSLRSMFRRETVEKLAVRDVSFRVGEGEIVGLIGANGAGKTTLVKMLAGIVHPTSAATARVLGFDPWERDDALPPPDRADHGPEGPALVGPARRGLLPAAAGDLPDPEREVPRDARRADRRCSASAASSTSRCAASRSASG